MTTEAERLLRWRVYAVVAIALIAAGLAIHGVLTGAEWVEAVVRTAGSILSIVAAATLTSPAARLLALRTTFDTYAESCLQIIDKDGKFHPLISNRAQRYLHARAEDQLKRRGWVRLIVLKGRQQGISTYIGGRFYWKASGQFGKRFVILTHLQEATDTLFGMVKRYHDNVPAAVRPKTKNDNAKELNFDVLKTRYAVATAGSRGTGRGSTAQFFHGSEVAFWPNAEKHMAGIGQIVPMAEGTEIFLESTANGIGNLFHSMVLKALKGRGDYELVFIPWFWQDEYQRAVPDGVVFDAKEIEYQEAFSITDEQLYWRRHKIEDDFNNDETLFDQEYPATIEMAFMAGTARALINPMRVARAMSNKLKDDSHEALVLGVDPAEYGDDDTAAVLRRGHKVLKTWRWSKEGNAQIAGRIGMILEEYKEAKDAIDAVCIDVTGVGTGVEAFLTDAGYQNIYRIHNGNSAIEDEKYRNRGAECWGRMADWLKDISREVSLPEDDTVLQAELSSRKFHYDARRRLVLQSKEEMQREGIPSPNTADALALTFAISVEARGRRRRDGETLAEKLRRLQSRQGRGGSPGMAA